MHVITRKRLNEFVEQKDQTAKPALDRWYKRMKRNTFRTPYELLQKFTSHEVDRVGKFTVFNVGGKTAARLIVAIHYNRQKVYIRNVLTHAEYDKGNWKE
jgi:mRNA interferase HigB